MVKAKNVDILSWEYIKQEDRYAITFKIKNLEPERIQRIIKRHKSGFLNSQGVNIEEIAEIDRDLYVKEYYTNEDIEDYLYIIPLIRKGIIPERLNPHKLEIEVEMCLIEQEIRYRMEHAGENI